MDTKAGEVTVSVINTYGNELKRDGFTDEISSIMQVKTVVRKNDAGVCCSFCNKRYCEEDEEINRWDAFDCMTTYESKLGFFIVCSDCRYFAALQIHNVGDNIFMQYADDDVWYKSGAYYPMNY